MTVHGIYKLPIKCEIREISLWFASKHRNRNGFTITSADSIKYAAFDCFLHCVLAGSVVWRAGRYDWIWIGLKWLSHWICCIVSKVSNQKNTLKNIKIMHKYTKLCLAWLCCGSDSVNTRVWEESKNYKLKNVFINTFLYFLQIIWWRCEQQCSFGNNKTFFLEKVKSFHLLSY